jgi:hypothetical protein
MVAVFFQKSKMVFVSFKKIRNKILVAYNVELYYCEESRFKIRCILGYIKMTNFNFSKCAPFITRRSTYLSFLPRPKNNAFQTDFFAN